MICMRQIIALITTPRSADAQHKQFCKQKLDKKIGPKKF